MDDYLLCSSQDSDWSLFLSDSDDVDDISLEDITECSVPTEEPNDLDENLFVSDDTSIPEDDITSPTTDDFIKLEDLYQDETLDSTQYSQDNISLEDLQESQSNSYSSIPSSSPSIPDFDQLQNLPHEIVERSRYSISPH